MIAPETLIAALMARVRRELYDGRPPKQWYQQQDTVKKALTFPAAWLEERKVPMSARRYHEIMGGILDTIRQHGEAKKVTYPGAYLLHCVQQHMLHHGDEYYQEGKSTRNRVTLDMEHVERAVAARRAAGSADVVPAFAQAHAALAVGKSKGRPKAGAVAQHPAGPLQADLFGGAKPRKKG